MIWIYLNKVGLWGCRAVKEKKKKTVKSHRQWKMGIKLKRKTVDRQTSKSGQSLNLIILLSLRISIKIPVVSQRLELGLGFWIDSTQVKTRWTLGPWMCFIFASLGWKELNSLTDSRISSTFTYNLLHCLVLSPWQCTHSTQLAMYFRAVSGSGKWFLYKKHLFNEHCIESPL